MQSFEESKKTGYLNENFRFFHIREKNQQHFASHYHDFHKIVVFLSGNVTYYVEGKAYYLKPWDVLFIGRHNVHKPLIHTNDTYDRIIIWIKNEFIESLQTPEDNLAECFSLADRRGMHLMRSNEAFQLTIRELLFQLETSCHSEEFAAPLLSNSLFLQLLIHLNRYFFQQKAINDTAALQYDKQIGAILLYINQNLTADLSIDRLAERFYLSRYHLMHKFKKETGYTIHNYIEQKRLIHATTSIRKGTPVMQAAKDSGFLDYSTFLRVFRKKYGVSPKKYALQNSTLPYMDC